MTLKELHIQLSALSSPDRATAIQILTRNLNNAYPHVSAANLVNVWAYAG